MKKHREDVISEIMEEEDRHCEVLFTSLLIITSKLKPL